MRFLATGYFCLSLLCLKGSCFTALSFVQFCDVAPPTHIYHQYKKR